jgi:hypothetical protein
VPTSRYLHTRQEPILAEEISSRRFPERLLLFVTGKQKTFLSPQKLSRNCLEMAFAPKS